MMKKVVGVRFKTGGRMYYFDPGELAIAQTDGVIVETARGTEFAEVCLTPREIPEEQIVAPLKDVLRVATPEDWDMREKSAQKEEEAFTIASEKIIQHGLDMKLVDVEYTFNGSKITFFFTAEGRVDFRELVKDLAYVFKTRIELRQIGVRDEAKMLGGLGSCGRPVCCKTFLEDFQPVSIKMAKEQNLSLSPTKISGLCGRLMCCLKYEQEAYEHMRKLMPRVNKEVFTPDGRGMVLDNNAITEKTRVRVSLPDGTYDNREYHYTEVRRPQPGEEYVPPAPPPKAEAPEENDAQPPQRQQRPAQRRQSGDEQRNNVERRPQQPRRKPSQPDKREPAAAQPGAVPAAGDAAKTQEAQTNKPRSRNRRGGRNRRPRPAGGARAQQQQATPREQE